jgi:hypothetical protein
MNNSGINNLHNSLFLLPVPFDRPRDFVADGFNWGPLTTDVCDCKNDFLQSHLLRFSDNPQGTGCLHVGNGWLINELKAFYKHCL